MSGEGEFVAVKSVKQIAIHCLWVKNLPGLRVFLIEIWGYTGLKDRHGITEQWFCLQMPGRKRQILANFGWKVSDFGASLATIVKFTSGSLQGKCLRDFVARCKEKVMS